MKYIITIINQSSLQELFDDINGPTYDGLFRNKVYGERPALRYESGQLFVWYRSGNTANAATIRTFINPDGGPKEVFHTLAEDPLAREELLTNRFRITHDTGLRFQDSGDKQELNSLYASIGPGWDAQIFYQRPTIERGNLFIAPLTFCFDMDNEQHKGTLRFLLEDEHLKTLALVLPPRPVPPDSPDQPTGELSGTDWRLESIRNLVVTGYSQVDAPPAGVVAVKCLQNPYIQDAVLEGAYLRFTDTPAGRKLQLAVPRDNGYAPNDIYKKVQQYRLDFFTDDFYYSGWRKEVREDLLKPLFEHFVQYPPEERVCVVDHLDEAAIAHSNSLQRFTSREVRQRLGVYRDAVRSGEHIDNLPGQFQPHAGRADEVRGRLNAYEGQLWNVWEQRSPESYRLLKELAAGLGEPEKDVVVGLINEVQGMTNIGLVVSLFWPLLRPFLGMDQGRAVPALGLPETYAAFLESLGILADHGTAQAVDYFLDNSRMVEPGTSRQEKFVGPVSCLESGNGLGYEGEESPLAIYYQQIAPCLRATILLHLLCPLNVRILPGASIQTQKEVEDPDRPRALEYLRTIAQFNEGLGYIVG